MLTALLHRLRTLLCRLRRPDKVMYIGGSDTLPPPLPRDEEAALLARLDGGELSVRQTLIERNLRLVVYIARRFENTGINIEDLISIGTIGLIKAVNTFKVDKNIKLATYASRCIENEILMHLRKTANQKGEISLNEPLNTDWDGNELLLSDVLGTDSDYTSFLTYYRLMLDMISQALPNTKIYVQSITPVRPEVSQKSPGLYKERLCEINDALSAIALEKGCTFLNLWEALADENGDLIEEYAQPDGYHLLPAGYDAWVDYLCTHT